MSAPIQIVNIQSGDFLVVQTDVSMEMDEANRIADSLKTRLEATGLTIKGVLVLPNGLHLNILRGD